VARSELSRRRLATVAALALSSAFAVALVAARVAYTDRPDGLNLVWNLVLAWVPFLLAVFVYDRARRGASLAVLVAGGALWLLFFPNAPYLITDFKLLPIWQGAPIWFDVVVLSTAAWTGLALGFVSLYLVQAVVGRLLGAVTSWLFVLSVLALGSFGIYLGRFERWNSWDVFAEPGPLLRDIGTRIANPAEHGRTVAVTVLFTVFLGLSYAVFYALTHPRLLDE
jgi:uncharacterized membrane protein